MERSTRWRVKLEYNGTVVSQLIDIDRFVPIDSQTALRIALDWELGDKQYDTPVMILQLHVDKGRILF
jgi:hypothetical protein